MKTYILVYFICAAFILSGCVSNSSPDEPLPTLSNTLEKNVGSINIEEYISEKPELKDTVLTAEIKISPLTEKVSDAVLPNVSLNNEALKSERSQILEKKINEEIERQLLLNPELPSLLTAAEIYEQTTIQLFTGLSEATGGETFMIDNADYVVRIIKEIIKNYLTDKTDFVFMVDRTTSMDDDIDAIK